MCLEWSGIGKGDYRSAPAEIKMPDGSFTADFVYKSHRITDGSLEPEALPSSYGDGDACQTLEISMLDESNGVSLLLYFTVYRDTNVITRRAVLLNGNAVPLTIRKLMSMSLDIPDDGFKLVTFDGGWIKEAHKHEQRLSYGIHVNSSVTGASSNRHNPGFLLAASDASENHGGVYGFNLVYSGNHYGETELSNQGLVRVQLGINPHCFEWTLKQNERFETPEAIFSFSSAGFNGLSRNFHDFINNHIVRGDWKGKQRPVLLNNWEAHFFKFTRGKLLRLARRAKRLGIEMFVLDDGWFGERDSDKAGLGDYNVNRKKLPRGLSEFSNRIHRMGMSFGLWFEPEMVNEDSALFRAHPEYALQTPNKKSALGRNQLVLDLCNPKVRDYIVENVTRILDTCGIDYVKWDFNRHISDAVSPCLENQGEFFHRYVLGLYDVLNRVFRPRPHILLESCSSGGNRFDAGMLCFSPQIWASDDTDPIERLKIQGGLSYLYPPSTMGAHVSEAPHQQTLRDTPLATRFNVAAFGALGYELDLKYLSRIQLKEVREQIAFYKKYRSVFQYGAFRRGELTKDNKVVWHCFDEKSQTGITGFFQTQSNASEGFDRLRFAGLTEGRKYRVTTRPQSLFIKRFGGLVKHIMPVALNPEGFLLRTANRYYAMTDCVEEYSAYGGVLMQNGILLNNQFVGSYYNDKIRLLGDFGSNLYIVQAEDKNFSELEGG
jgi:alpha-galactosidase